MPATETTMSFLNRPMVKILSFMAAAFLMAQGSLAQEAPGKPGIAGEWAPARKDAIGTAYEARGARSPLWFTVAQGVPTEAFYPSIDQAQMRDLQFLVTGPSGFFSEQRKDCLSHVRYSRGMVVEIECRHKDDAYAIRQIMIADPALPVIRIKTRFERKKPGLKLYLLFNPTINNSANHNMGLVTAEYLHATAIPRKNARHAVSAHAAVRTTPGFMISSVGYVGYSDGWTQLHQKGEIDIAYPEAGPGNIALIGRLAIPDSSTPDTVKFETAIAFGESRTEAVERSRVVHLGDFEQAVLAYRKGWVGYLDSLDLERVEKTNRHELRFARRSAAFLKMHEDKTYRGAMVASLSKPGIPKRVYSGDGNNGGYHLVWPRDLYHTAMAMLASGDERTPVDTLEYLLDNQKPDGSWYQNFWINGAPYWRGVQLDETAFPIMLADRLIGLGLVRATPELLVQIRRAADFIISYGPKSQQDRWEEIGGYIPSTIASTITALRATGKLTGMSHYDETANLWSRQLEGWTAVAKRGSLGSNYYLRVSPSGDPSKNEKVWIANDGGQINVQEMLDGGFLELVRYGVRNHDHATVVNTLGLMDRGTRGISAQTNTPNGTAIGYRRYNGDRYGNEQTGGFWPLLAGERGHYEIARGDRNRALAQFDFMFGQAGESGHLPEQVIRVSYDANGLNDKIGLGVPTPLAWSHGEYLLLRRSIQDNRVFDLPL